jgi:hypothetical protein
MALSLLAWSTPSLNSGATGSATAIVERGSVSGQRRGTAGDGLQLGCAAEGVSTAAAVDTDRTSVTATRLSIPRQRRTRGISHGYIVYIKRNDLDPRETPVVAHHVGDINSRLVAEHIPYLLIGPGRWGSSDPRLGVSVKWAQICGARLIIETAFTDRDVEPSQRAHFFHNVTPHLRRLEQAAGLCFEPGTAEESFAAVVAIADRQVPDTERGAVDTASEACLCHQVDGCRNVLVGLR